MISILSEIPAWRSLIIFIQLNLDPNTHQKLHLHIHYNYEHI